MIGAQHACMRLAGAFLLSSCTCGCYETVNSWRADTVEDTRVILLRYDAAFRFILANFVLYNNKKFDTR